MEIKKKNDDSYDTYSMTVSFLELKTFADALTRGGVGPVADEMRRSIEWHMDRVPKPGQSKEEFDAEKEAAKAIEGDEDVSDFDLGGDEEIKDDDLESPVPKSAEGPKDDASPQDIERSEVDVEADELLPEPPTV